MSRGRRSLRAAMLVAVGFVLGAIAVGGAMAAKYVTGGDTEVTAVKLTGGGLPNLGTGSSTYGVAELPAAIREYHDSGRYESELANVDSKAKSYLTRQLKRLRQTKGPGKFTECNNKGRRCKAVKPAIVLDIDETSLSNYANLSAADFSAAGSAVGVVAGNDPVIAPTLELYDYARANKVDVFFITGRPEVFRPQTESNLNNVGYDDGYSLTMRPADATSTIAYKSGARGEIEQDGFTILVNVGDQDSDLAGGNARRAFKLPNPMYFIP